MADSMGGPCGPDVTTRQIIMLMLSSVTTVLVTWLTVRAKRKDREENGRRQDRSEEP